MRALSPFEGLIAFAILLGFIAFYGFVFRWWPR
jgi:hypothetical protein